jgi:hypothetical protein
LCNATTAQDNVQYGFSTGRAHLWKGAVHGGVAGQVAGCRRRLADALHWGWHEGPREEEVKVEEERQLVPAARPPDGRLMRRQSSKKQQQGGNNKQNQQQDHTSSAGRQARKQQDHTQALDDKHASSHSSQRRLQLACLAPHSQQPNASRLTWSAG